MYSKLGYFSSGLQNKDIVNVFNKYWHGLKHHSSLQCHMILNYSNMLICSSRNISY